MTVNFNQFSESKCLGANKNGNSPAPPEFEFVKRWPFYSSIFVSGGKNTPNSDVARASDEFQIQTEKDSSSIHKGKVVKRWAFNVKIKL